MLEKLFGLTKAKTSVKTEIMAGVATFLTMAYITVVNPAILSTEGSGMDFGAVFTATIIAAVIGTLIMGLWANWPVALAPGMGLNAFFTFGVIFGMGYTFQQALAAVFVAGIVFIGLSVTPARKYIINSIPRSMKLGVGAGIGLFLAIIGFKNAGIVVDQCGKSYSFVISTKIIFNEFECLSGIVDVIDNQNLFLKCICFL